MVADLRLGTTILVCPIVREADGLALSSRNAYLGPGERKQALALSRVIRRVEALAAGGERTSSSLIDAAHRVLAEEPEVRVDYIELVDWETLWPVLTVGPGTLFAIAAWVGGTRLIDNTVIG